MNPFQKLAYEIRRGQVLREKVSSTDMLLGYLMGSSSDLPKPPDFKDIPHSHVLAAGGLSSGAVGGLGGFALGEHLQKTKGLSKKNKILIALSSMLGSGAVGAAALGKAHKNVQ